MRSRSAELCVASLGVGSIDIGVGEEEVGVLVPGIFLVLHRHGSLLGGVCLQEQWQTGIVKVRDGIE